MELVALVAALTLSAAGALGARRSPAVQVREVAVLRSEGGIPGARSSSRPFGGPPPKSPAPPFGHDTRELLNEAFIVHPGYAASAATVLAAFRQAEAGYPAVMCDLFDDFCEPDGHLGSLFEKRNQAVAGKDYTIQAGGEDGDAELAAHILRITFGDQPMVETFQHLLTTNKYGWSGAEIDWTVRIIEGRTYIVPSWFTLVRARRFRITNVAMDGVNDQLRLYTDPARPRGDELRPDKWIILRADASTPMACAGLMRCCAWFALGKRFAFRDWMVFSDKFGKPLPIASYDDQADDGSKEVATEVIQNIGNDVGAVVPKSIGFDLKEAVGVDNSKTHGGLIAHCNAEMSKRVNGSTLANDNTGSGGASYALGDVHDTVRWEAVQYDATRLQAAFRTQVFEPFMRFNNLVGATPEMHIQVVRDLDPTKRIDILTKAKNLLGLEVSGAQVRRELTIREPTNASDSLKGAPAGAEPMPKTPNPKITENT